MSDIFISYKREEQAEARKLADALEREGWTVWWDPKLRAGEHFDDVIEAALKDSKCVIVMWSRLSVESRYVKDEANYALNRHKLVPVAIEDVKLPFRFEGIHTPQLNGWDGSEDYPAYKKLLEDIIAIIGPPRHKRVGANRPKTTSESDAKVNSQRTAGLIIGTSIMILLAVFFVKVIWSAQPALSIAPPAPLTVEEKPKVTNSEHITAKPEAPKPSNKTLGIEFRDRLKDGTEGPVMVHVPAGSFAMGDIWGNGDKKEKPTHPVHIPRDFAIGKYEVTFEDYDKFAHATGRTPPTDYGMGRVKRPTFLSWYDAVAYAEWLSQQTGQRYRLPSEAEWEYAARSGGKEEKWAGTSDELELGDYAWYLSNKDGKPQLAGRKKPNGLGLHDMSGNVSEWVEDCWNEGYAGAPDDGSPWKSGDCGQRIVRGGNWSGGQKVVRSVSRYSLSPESGGGLTIGFRLARDLEGQLPR